MPFDEEEQDQDLSPKKGLRKVSSQKSIFDDLPKKPTQKDLDRNVKIIQERSNSYKQRAAVYSAQFKKMMNDKTLKQNRNVFVAELESELLANMIKLSVDVNVDTSEQEGMGSLMWVILLLKTCFSQRDRINDLEYKVAQLENKTDPAVLEPFIKKEIRAMLDNPKNSE